MDYAQTHAGALKPLDWWYDTHATPKQHSQREQHSFGAFRRSVVRRDRGARGKHAAGDADRGSGSTAEEVPSECALSECAPSVSTPSQGGSSVVLPSALRNLPSISARSATGAFPAAAGQARPGLPQLTRRRASLAVPSPSTSPRSTLGDTGWRRQFLPRTGVRPESGAWRADGSMRPKRQRSRDGARRRPQRKRERQQLPQNVYDV